MNRGELYDTIGVVLCVAGAVLCGLGHAPWYAFLFPGMGIALHGLRLLARAM